MKCPNCKTEMIKGMLVSQGSQWIQHTRDRDGWIDKLSAMSHAVPVVAWRCPHCNKLELRIEAK